MTGDFFDCRLCGQNGKPAKSHVLPNAFFQHALRDENKILQVSLEDVEISAPRQSGPWDRRLLCQSCESRFHSLDTYGVSILRDRECFEWRIDNCWNYQLAFLFGVNGEMLRRFILFVAWRILASTRPEFKRASDVHAEHTLRGIICEERSITDQFPVLLSRYEGQAIAQTSDGVEHVVDPRSVILMPGTPRDFCGQRAMEIQFGEYEAAVAIDGAVPDGPWSTLTVPDCGPIPVFLRSFADSSTLKLVRRSFAAKRPIKPR